jgi:hypothetical protein
MTEPQALCERCGKRPQEEFRLYPLPDGGVEGFALCACESAELHDVRVHDLRHTFAVHWIMAGLPLNRLQRILGHRTPTMTMRYARHAPEAHFADDAARLGASLSGVTQKPDAPERADTA